MSFIAGTSIHLDQSTSERVLEFGPISESRLGIASREATVRESYFADRRNEFLQEVRA